MVNYAELLKRYIAQSGMTLEEIANACAKLGVSIHPTYISKLRLGQRPAPSEDISRALAKVTGGDPEELVVAGYLEKAPQEVKNIIDNKKSPQHADENPKRKRVYKIVARAEDLPDEQLDKVEEYIDLLFAQHELQLRRKAMQSDDKREK